MASLITHNGIRDKVHIHDFIHLLLGTFSSSSFSETLGKGIVVNFELSDLKF